MLKFNKPSTNPERIIGRSSKPGITGKKTEGLKG